MDCGDGARGWESLDDVGGSKICGGRNLNDSYLV